jgi:hypothetical protein
MQNPNSLIKHFGLILPAAILVFAGGCSTLRVRTDYNHTADFEQYHTYSWIRVNAGNSLWAQRIRRDVNAELAAKGWHEVPSGGEAAIAAFGATRQQPTLQTFYSGLGPDYGGWYWGGWGWNEGMATTQMTYTPIGTLVVDIFNNNSRRLLWRGVARQALAGSPEKNEHKLANAVDKMFRNFPPPSRG